ncbi:U3 snoRNP protein [Yamadazyma tenuis]|uniref:Uncharacterized protein n=1 Tax=Candida tenuis (strain ATCC 10573 / BCRC 21748 / CBS 615 / JCM 9827 / NBRC 10315 / NRRL Y-1498 / VKM Y-70) TaxID=590646 RepID=G3B745_CANTC|nr:uncharacterized protein CANTEDRAFT_93865 [Yamadazyma tenuis ATCC 10573]EGV63095.1 hypothetical protein CANTEDRAFT_93865 [Yamadazyma tenuis ATCC 10573]WEJ97090.1 U3 snoRNP protein [Yamadazyma tenuis]
MSFVDFYPILTLPRVSDLPLHSRVIVSPLSSITETNINIAISKSNISSYILYPSPRLVWSYPISPSSVVECMDVKDDSYMIGITDRKTFKLLSLNKGSEESNSIKLKHRIANIKFEEFVWVVLGNGDVLKIDPASLEVIETISNDEQGTHVFSNLDKHILVVTKVSDQLSYKLIHNGVVTHYEAYTDSLFEFNDKHIYRFNKSTKTIEKVDLTFKVQYSVDLSHLLAEGPFSLSVPSEDRVVISDNIKMHLVNLKYESKLAEFQFDDNCDHEILTSIKVKGNSLNTTDTRLFYLKLNSKKNKLNLNLLNLNIEVNTLLANLNKGFKPNENREILQLTNLIDEVYEIKKDTAVHKLVTLYGKDLSKFEIQAIRYLKDQEVKPSHYYSFDSEDKPVDPQAIEKFVSLIFSKENDTLTIKGKVPKFILYYLLSHKLYPSQYTKGLLRLLLSTGNLRLLKQSITFTPGIDVSDLVEVLIYSDNSTVTNDILVRLNDYKVEEVIEMFKTKLSEGENVNGLIKNLIELNNFNSFKLLKNLIDLNGLVSSMRTEVIRKLTELVNYKIRLVELNSLNLNLVNNRIKLADTRVPKYSFEPLES